MIVIKIEEPEVRSEQLASQNLNKSINILNKHCHNSAAESPSRSVLTMWNNLKFSVRLTVQLQGCVTNKINLPQELTFVFEDMQSKQKKNQSIILLNMMNYRASKPRYLVMCYCSCSISFFNKNNSILTTYNSVLDLVQQSCFKYLLAGEVEISDGYR